MDWFTYLAAAVAARGLESETGLGPPGQQRFAGR
jgi:hypothetical protein